jgi:hypothetical protein
MNQLQWERWRDFSMRMARTCFATSRRPPGKFVVRHVEAFLGCVGDYDGWKDVFSWDGWKGECLTDHLSDYLVELFYTIQLSEEPAETWDERRDLAEDQYNEQWLGPIRCCIRAGLDAATDPDMRSMGTMGFTAGDLRRMYPEGVPDWVFPPEETLEVQTFTGVIPGMGLVPGERHMNGTFAELPDCAELWL